MCFVMGDRRGFISMKATGLEAMSPRNLHSETWAVCAKHRTFESRSILKSIRLTRSTIILNAPGTGPLGLLRVCHAEDEDPVARLKSVLAGHPPVRQGAWPPGEDRSVDWSRFLSMIRATDWSAHQLHVEQVDDWDVLPIETPMVSSG